MSGEVQLERINFLGYPVDQISMPQALQWIDKAIINRDTKHIVVLNANKLYLMARHTKLNQIVQNADLIIPEWAVVWGAKQLYLPPLIHLGGIMLTRALMPHAAEKGLRPYLLGASREVVTTLAEKLKAKYPALKLVGFHHGYLTTSEIDDRVVAHIQQLNPDILFVAMGSPRQEVWIDTHLSQLGVPVSIGVGGSFDVLAGLKKDTPDWARGNGLEWIYRFWQDPRTYWKRYLVTNIWFLWQIIKAPRKTQYNVS